MGQPIVPTLLSIQYLRAFAALAVVAYHAGQWVLSPMAVGAAGVDIFFFVSGFVMWTTTWRRPMTPLAFLQRRLVRVAPLYWIATLALGLGVAALPGVFPNTTLEAGHVLKSLLFIPHLNPQGAPFPLLAPGWTLHYEAVFYLAVGASLLVAPGRRLAVLAALLVPVSCLGLFYFPAYRLGANPMMLQFLGGALVGRLWLQRSLPSASVGAGLLTTGLVLFGATHFIGVQPDFFARPFLWGAPALLVVLGAVSMEAGAGLPRWGLARRLGDASYSIYICHTPTMALFNAAVGPTNPYLFFGLAVALSVGAGLLCHRFVERPLLAFLRRPRGATGGAVAAPRDTAA